MHRGAVLAVCLAHQRDPHAAEDCVQETFLKALGKLAELRDPTRARAWLCQIARRTCLDQPRRPIATLSLPDDRLALQADAGSGRAGGWPSGDAPAERAAQLHAALARLPADYRETLALYYLEGRDCAQVAAALGLTPAAVRQRLVRGRLRLHELLTEDDRWSPEACCRSWRERVTAAVLGELDASGSEAVEQHLRKCASCRALHAALLAEEPDVRAAFEALAAAAGSPVGRSATGPAGIGNTPGVGGSAVDGRSITTVTRNDGGTFPAAASPPRRRRLPMRFTFLMPAAAAVVVAVLVSTWPGGRSAAHAYTITDMPKIMRTAVIHTRGQMHPLPGRADSPVMECEYWFDLAGVRVRQPQPWYETGPEGTTLHARETIVDGEYELVLDHTARTAEFHRLNALRRVLHGQRTLRALLDRFFGGAERLDAFRRSGNETIDGAAYERWELEIEETTGLVAIGYRMHCALAPRTGDVGYVRMWVRMGGAEWQPYLMLGKWERLSAAPAGTFDTTAPPGYALKNTKESAALRPLQYEGGASAAGVSYKGHISFRLPDGSILLAWSSRDEQSDGSQAALFEGLTFGGPLPKLPVEIASLRQEIDGRTITYTGRHVARTRAGEFHEWALYVPQGDAPSQKSRTLYQAVCRFNLPGDGPAARMDLFVSQPFFVESAADFDQLVRGAMSELAGGQAPPAEVTWESVLKLARETRASVRPSSGPRAG